MKQLLLLLGLSLFHDSFLGQTLQVPPRAVDALSGTEVVSIMTPMSLVNRENYILNEVLSGNIPDFQRNMVLVRDSALISAVYRRIEYYVIPDYLALGSNTDYFLCPMTPILAQRLADSINCVLPTRKMVNQIFNNSQYKMNPESIAPSAQMTTVPVFDDHNDMVWTQRQPNLGIHPLGELIVGDKKDVVISNQIYTLPAPKRVLIYGWHYPNGSNIQPLYGGHVNTYADYSHGIRFVQEEMYLDGVPTSSHTILGSETLNSLLSDEGVINQAYYPDTASISSVPFPNVPSSFYVKSTASGSVQVKIKSDPNVDQYLVFYSYNGSSWTQAANQSSNIFSLTGLTANVPVYIKLKASNTTGTSSYSEVLGAVSSTNDGKVLIVNGFDRPSTGNTYDFVLEHGKAVHNYGVSFSSATNEAIIDNLIGLSEFEVVDIILGEESTAQETFNTTEQTYFKTYLMSGGKLFVSGAEIAWDLDNLGSAGDKEFYNNYLKASYVMDAPNNQSSTYYTVSSLVSTPFSGVNAIDFDNGTFGTYNVDYPDVIAATAGGISCFEYEVSGNFAGVYFDGMFPSGSQEGKLVNLGFPFETVYPEPSRLELMNSILDFFFNQSTAYLNSKNLKKLVIHPNPFIQEINVWCNEDNLDYQIVDTHGKSIVTGMLSYNMNKINLEFMNRGLYFLQLKDGTTIKIEKQ